MVLFTPISPVSPLLLTILLSSFARSVSSSSNQSYGSTSHISSWSKAHRPGVANITNKETESQNPCQSADIHQEDNWVIHKKRHKNKRSLSFTTSYPHSQLHHSGKEENVTSNKPEREREKKKKGQERKYTRAEHILVSILQLLRGSLKLYRIFFAIYFCHANSLQCMCWNHTTTIYTAHSIHKKYTGQRQFREGNQEKNYLVKPGPKLSQELVSRLLAQSSCPNRL